MADQTPEIPALDPVLKTGASKRNVEAARKALARISELGWEPLAAYPGSDTHWKVRCILCDWSGVMFYSHMRRARRHKGCLSKDLVTQALDTLNNSRR